MPSTTADINVQELVSLSLPHLQDAGLVGFCASQCGLFAQYARQHYSMDVFQTRTQRAAAPLQSLQDMICYNAFYLARHYATFKTLLQFVQGQSCHRIDQPVSLKIIDYGCGQGLASLVLLEHLKDRVLDIDLHLVEPSSLSLFAARCYVQDTASRLNGNIQVHYHQGGLNQLSDDVFQKDPKQATIHLFSNVLDLANQGYFSLPALLLQIRRSYGNHLCLAASPNYWSGNLGFDLLKQNFPEAKLLVDDCITTTIPPDYSMVSMKSGQTFRGHYAKGRMLAMLFCTSPVAVD